MRQRPAGERRRGSDGAEYELGTRIIALDPLSQSITYEMHPTCAGMAGTSSTEQHLLKMTMYFTNEIGLMLERAGFVGGRGSCGLHGRQADLG
jgi:hypothetical protein